MQIPIMKKAIIPILTAAISMTLFTACHHDSLENRAERDARDYTERYCPTPFTDNQRTDSITFTRADKTFHYFYTLRDEADNAEIINQHKASLKQALQDDLDKNTQSKAYKDAGFRFHYVFRSGKTAKVLFEQTLKGKH